MNNPFSRLKHYLPVETDSQENHATECLAACLVFSEKLRTSSEEELVNLLAERAKQYAKIVSSLEA